MLPGGYAVASSVWQVALQPSPAVLLPSSQVSPVSTLLLPHTAAGSDSVWQVALQPSPAALLPSSHCSAPSFLPSPHTAAPMVSVVQVFEQPSPSVVLPSSHCSAPSFLPLPHLAGLGPFWQTEGSPSQVQPGITLHALSQPSVATLLPSSHCSLPGSMVPSPHQVVLPGFSVDTQSVQQVRPDRKTAVSRAPSPASHTTTDTVWDSALESIGMSIDRRGVVPSNCVPLLVMTESPEKNGPLIEMRLPLGSSATFLPSTKIPTTSLKLCPTNSGYSSEPTTNSRCRPLTPVVTLNVVSKRAAS